MSTLISAPPARRRPIWIPSVLLLVVLAACSGAQAAPEDDETSEPEPTRVAFDPADFVDPATSTNPYHPLRPGMQWVRAGTTEVGSRKVPYEVISTMTDVVRVIDGVPAIAMLDRSTDAGELVQMGMDYFGLDTDGNVWILGGYTEDYEGGEYTNTEDAWLGAETDGVPGILVPGTLTATTPRWFVGAADAEDAGSVAEPVEVGARVCVPFDCYDDVKVVREGEVGAIDNEFKYYAAGVGVVKNAPKDESLHQDTFELTNLIELSPEGLAEASQTVLDLEEHARTTSADVYGSAPEARRLP